VGGRGSASCIERRGRFAAYRQGAGDLGIESVAQRFRPLARAGYRQDESDLGVDRPPQRRPALRIVDQS
jgi:hypothetical protein